MSGGGRLRPRRPDELDQDQRKVYDAIAGGRRAQGSQQFRLVGDDGSLEGPFNAFLLQPRLGLALQDVGAAIRYETSLSDRMREIAILVVSQHWNSDFERYAHEAIGRHIGLTDDELTAIRELDYDGLDADDRLIARTASRLAVDGDLDDREYAETLAVLGEPGLFELSTLVGYYAALALQLRLFRVAAPGS